MTREEALTLMGNLKEQGTDATIVTFDDGESGLLIQTKAGPSVGIVEPGQLDDALDLVQELEKKY